MFPRPVHSLKSAFLCALAPAAILLVVVLSADRPALAGQIISTWNGGASNWNTAAKWTPAVVPNNGGGNTYDVRIDGSNAAASNVTLDLSPTIDLLTVDADDRLTIANAYSLTVAGGGIANAGTVALSAVGSYADLRISGGDVTLSGGGTVALSNSTVNRIMGTAGTERFINANNTIRGSGQVGFNLMALTNQGTIQADQTNSLTIDPNAAGVINTGTMRATAGATLVLSNGTFTNFVGSAQGLIRADASTVRIEYATVSGGQVDVVGGGEIRLTSATVSDGLLTNSGTGVIHVAAGTSTLGGTVKNPEGGQITVDNGNALVLLSGGTYANAGAISLNAVGSYTDLRMSGGAVTLSGGGTVAMTNSTTNRIIGTAGTDRLINADNTIRGAGTISALLTNRGTVEATGLMYLNTYAKINDGTFRASPGGTLMVDIGASGTGRWEAAGGKIQVGAVTVSTTGPISVTAGGELELNGSTMTGSNLTMDPSGILDVNSVLSLSGDLSFAMTAESKWDWGSAADLAMTGGVGAKSGQWLQWASLEVGGMDLGTDPATHVGAAAGFSANFDLTKLVIGAGAHVYLADLFDNGNRVGAYGQGEALYVDTLTFIDPAGVLDLNDLHLYYKNSNAGPGQIINEVVPEPATLALLGAGALAALAARRSERSRSAARRCR